MGSLQKKIAETCRRIRERGDDGVWISLFPEDAALERAAALESADLPLRGLTVAVKDNIDVAGLPTTAACPEFSYSPAENAIVVQRLLDAGVIIIGKTNLDQFATGLNGTRTPHTIPRNAIDSAYVSGGSSSGSAVAVAAGLVDFALGTDTAGSGRVPAAFNNLVGLKPTRGRWSTRGLVPACRTLDCITVLSKGLALAEQVDAVARGFDSEDPYSRRQPDAPHVPASRVAVLPASHRQFFGDDEYARLYQEAIARAEAVGWDVGEFDYEPLLEAATLLYSGPWVAERQAALGDFLKKHPEAVHPVIRGIIEGAERFTAADAFTGQYRLATLARKAGKLWQSFDALLLPTAGTIYTVEQMLADPVALNANLGHYTNFMNLLDLCGLALPAGFRGDGLPFGITFAAPAWQEEVLLELGRQWMAD